MRIVFWADGFWPRIGGIETQGFQFIKEMQERGHRCIVLAQKDHSSWKGEETYQGISIKRFDFNALLKKQELTQLRSIKEHLEWIVDDFRPDVIYLNTFVGGSAFVFLLFQKMFEMPVVATIHGLYYDKGLPPLVRQIFCRVDRIGSVSQWALNAMEEHLPLLKDKLRLIYNGLSIPPIVPLPLPFCPPIILALGRFSSEKGFDTAIKAFSLLKKAGSAAQLLMVGDGDERPYLEQLIDDLYLRDSSECIGSLARDSVPLIINRATCVVMPSYSEAFGLVALEAMQMGRPVIASRVGGIPEVVVDQETGLLVPPRDPLALYQAMELLLTEPQQIQKMGEQARKHAIENFSLKENVDGYENLFQECLC